MPLSSSETDTFGIKYSVDIMKALLKETAGNVEGSYQKQIQKVTAYYMGQQYNVSVLISKLRDLKTKCLNNLQQVEYEWEKKDEFKTYGKKKYKITIKEATDLIIQVNNIINGNLKEYIGYLQRMSASENFQ